MLMIILEISHSYKLILQEIISYSVGVPDLTFSQSINDGQCKKKNFLYYQKYYYADKRPSWYAE